MKGIHRLARSDPQWLGTEYIRVQAELKRKRSRRQRIEGDSNRLNKILKAFRIQERHRRNGAQPIQQQERK